MKFDIAKLSVESGEFALVRSNAGYSVGMSVSLQGVEGQDLLACCSEDLINDLLDAIGEQRVVEHFELKTAQ